MKTRRHIFRQIYISQSSPVKYFARYLKFTECKMFRNEILRKLLNIGFPIQTLHLVPYLQLAQNGRETTHQI